MSRVSVENSEYQYSHLPECMYFGGLAMHFYNCSFDEAGKYYELSMLRNLWFLFRFERQKITFIMLFIKTIKNYLISSSIRIVNKILLSCHVTSTHRYLLNFNLFSSFNRVQLNNLGTIWKKSTIHAFKYHILS